MNQPLIQLELTELADEISEKLRGHLGEDARYFYDSKTAGVHILVTNIGEPFGWCLVIGDDIEEPVSVIAESTDDILIIVERLLSSGWIRRRFLEVKREGYFPS